MEDLLLENTESEEEEKTQKKAMRMVKSNPKLFKKYFFNNTNEPRWSSKEELINFSKISARNQQRFRAVHSRWEKLFS